MRILLDECVPRRLRRALRDHHVVTVQELGWAGLRDADVLTRVGARFDVVLSVDRKLPAHVDVRTLPFAIVLLVGRSNRIEDLEPLMHRVARRLPECRPGERHTIADFQPGEIVRERAPAYRARETADLRGEAFSATRAWRARSCSPAMRSARNIFSSD